MKKTFTLFVAAFMYLSGHTQIIKGSSLLGGSVSFYSDTKKYQDTGSYASYNLSVIPAFGKAIDTNLIVGIGLLFDYESQQSIASLKFISRGYGLQFFVRKYKDISKRLYVFAEANLSTIVNYTNYSMIFNFYDNTYKSNTVSAGINVVPGVACTLTRKLQLEATLQNLLYVYYQHTKDELKTNAGITNKENAFSAGSSLNPAQLYGLSFGLRFLLNK